MDVKLIVTESNNSKDYVKSELMNDRNIGICSYILHYRDYSHDKLYIEIQNETWKFTPDGERQPHELCQWYVGKGYCKYCGVRVIVDGQEAAEPIISKEMKDTHDVHQHINEFMNEIKNTIDDLSGAGDYIELDDIVL
jgi:hypothetical protein